MSKNKKYVELEYLESAPLPQHAATYTVISHKRVNDKVVEELQKNGFEIEKIFYKANMDAQIASGTVLLKQGTDNEMRMMLTWANSYDKSMRFKCAVGGYLPSSESVVISGNMGTWGRKHTGNADLEMEKTIQDQLSLAGHYYNGLVEDKAVMKDIILDETSRASLLGILFFHRGIINTDQVAIIRKEMKKPSFSYNADPMSLWTLYCHIIYSLQIAHPKTWLDQQRLSHFYISEMFDLEKIKADNALQNAGPSTPSVKDPAQLDLVEEIEKAEKETMDTIAKDAIEQYPVTMAEIEKNDNV